MLMQHFCSLTTGRKSSSPRSEQHRSSVPVAVCGIAANCSVAKDGIHNGIYHILILAASSVSNSASPHCHSEICSTICNQT